MRSLSFETCRVSAFPCSRTTYEPNLSDQSHSMYRFELVDTKSSFTNGDMSFILLNGGKSFPISEANFHKELFEFC